MSMILQLHQPSQLVNGKPTLIKIVLVYTNKLEEARLRPEA